MKENIDRIIFFSNIALICYIAYLPIVLSIFDNCAIQQCQCSKQQTWKLRYHQRHAPNQPILLDLQINKLVFSIGSSIFKMSKAEWKETMNVHQA